MKKSKFPWWILLLLLPLILLIPIPRSINIQFMQGDVPVAENPASVEYPDISTFGTHLQKTCNGNTDTEGRMQVAGIKEPLWHVLFGPDDQMKVLCDNGCAGLACDTVYQHLVKNDINRLYLGQRTSSAVITVVDADDNEPLPDAQVVVTTGGGEPISATTNEAGQATIDGVPACGSITAIGSREGFHNDTISGLVSEIGQTPLRLKPLKGTVKVIVKDLKTKKTISGAQVVLTLDGSSQTLRTNTNGVGIGAFDDVRLSYQMALKASKTNYYDTTKQGFTVKQFVQMTEEQRTMYLRPKEAPKPPKEEKKEEKKPDPPKEEKKDEPTPPLRGQKGELRFNLSWSNKADLDIYVTDPCGNQLGPRNQRKTCHGSTGTIDIDANMDATNHPEKARTDPQENVFWNKAGSGKYRVTIHCCPLNRGMNLKSTTIPFTLVIEDRGQRTVKKGTITGKYKVGVSDPDVVLKDFYIHTVE